MRDEWTEAGVGAIVLLAAASFLFYSLTAAGSSHLRGYAVTARFGDVGALAPGAVVSVAGVKIGAVSSIKLDPKNFLAVARLDLDPSVPLPADSTAKITSDGLLGGAHIVIAPGASTNNLKPAGEIENTQGAVDLFGLIGQMLRPQAQGASSPQGSAPTGTTPSGAY
jgi:phospholipid/cholesterol/gamma-HCH transport system substrate-binding protein